jgi:hypothetical protein
MIITTYNSRAPGAKFDPHTFASRTLEAGFVTLSQARSLGASLTGFAPETLCVEKIGRKVWVTLLTERGAVWTWSIGAGGKTSASSVDVSEIQK